jgi:hypothetical protein
MSDTPMIDTLLGDTVFHTYLMRVHGMADNNSFATLDLKALAKEVATLTRERDALRTVYEATMDFVGAQGTPYEADQYLMLNGVLGAYHARAADAVRP